MFNPKIGINIGAIMEQYKSKYNPQAKERLVALSLARAISVQLQLPSSPVNNVFVYYASTHNDRVCGIISEINENYIVDTKFTAEMTFKLYKLRYRMVYEAQQLTRALFATYFDDDSIPQDLLDMAGQLFTPETDEVFTCLIKEFMNAGIKADADVPANAVPEVVKTLSAG